MLEYESPEISRTYVEDNVEDFTKCTLHTGIALHKFPSLFIPLYSHDPFNEPNIHQMLVLDVIQCSNSRYSAAKYISLIPIHDQKAGGNHFIVATISVCSSLEFY
jgi:hypothetical protein